ncbi:MAG TPA: hypothetical protein PL001_07740, partial [Candidatus Kryptobacter bacterium]|nr:hypothetical protein [Candidatus Kryptobacter bacterium]
MKGYLWTLVVALMLGISAAAGAQVPKFGATAGVNFSEVTNILGLHSRTGLIIGGFMTYEIIGPLAVRPELLFSMKGYKANIQLLGGGEDIVDATLNY